MSEYDIEKIDAMWERVQPRVEAANEGTLWPAPYMPPPPPYPMAEPSEMPSVFPYLIPNEEMTSPDTYPMPSEIVVPPAPAAERVDSPENNECFGMPMSEEALAFQALLYEEWRKMKLYAALTKAMRVRGVARGLDKRCKKQKGLVSRLTTAYYLMTAEQMVFSDEETENPALPWHETARMLFHAERKSMTQYRQIEAQTQDACLRELCGQASAIKEQASDELLHLLEAYAAT